MPGGACVQLGPLWIQKPGHHGDRLMERVGDNRIATGQT